ncbi:MAG: DNA polymerase I [Gammaproteobacteria bacterium RIFCSPHIGHO2_12_FULL_41_20]|nr:MAG: DNA polymerase I [Gammaproteobacteria bacterium RIFCSPHIGHO2_12_FULL_41_20]
MTKNNMLILVDGSSYLYRAFHALPPLTNAQGFPTGAIYGVTSMIQRLLAEYDPEYIAIVFDAKGKTFRDELFDDYKAHRAAMPDDLIRQIEPTHNIIRAMGLPLLIVDGVEADDVIGTLAKQADNQQLTTLISTGDKDLAQLVNERITLVNTMTNNTLTPLSVEEKFGVPPYRIIDYLTLIGDTSDNIPGIPQVGPKTAVKWLKEYGSLDAIVANADKISGKVGENLRANLTQLPLAKSLVAIKTDVKLPMDIADLKRTPENKDTLIKLYKELGFKTWLAGLLSDTPATTPQDKYANYEIITTESQLHTWVKKLSSVNLIAVDTETTSLDAISAKLVGISFAVSSSIAAYIPFGHDYTDAPQQLPMAQVLQQLQPIFKSSQIKKVGHNIKYDLEVFTQHGVELHGIIADTMLEAYVLESTALNYSMDNLARKLLDWPTIQFEDIAGKGKNQRTFNQIALPSAGTYAAEDADVTLQLHHVFWPRLEKTPSLMHVFENIEMPLIPVLARMEMHGVLVDAKKLKQQSNELTQRLHELELEAYTLAGATFNINSPKQLQEVLFQKLQLPVLQKTPTGQASTADPVLQELALDYPLPKVIIAYRSISKLISTYTERLPEQIHEKTGRIHTSYNQTGTATGRLSSSDPNLQNIPVRTIEGRRIRQAFIAPRGYKILSADYSQIELRLMAHISEDPHLIAAFEQNLDIHKATAAEVWGVPLDQVSTELRRNAKAINFGLIYGMSAFGLSRQLGIDRDAAQQYIQLYFSRYPQVQAYMDRTKELAREHGYVETLWGRRLYLPDIRAAKVSRQRAAERAAINAPLQGSAADIIKLAMIRIDQWLTQSHCNTKMIMQVHDELVFEIAEKEVDSAMSAIQAHMTDVVKLKIPLQVSIGVGKNWDEASAH